MLEAIPTPEQIGPMIAALVPGDQAWTADLNLHVYDDLGMYELIAGQLVTLAASIPTATTEILPADDPTQIGNYENECVARFRFRIAKDALRPVTVYVCAWETWERRRVAAIYDTNDAA
jgi:hypothetical protein